MEIKVFSIGNYKTSVFFTDTLPPFKKDYSGVLYIFDENTRTLFPEIPDYQAVVLPSGEEHKRWKSIDIIAAKAVSLGLARDSLFVGVGGGVVCDLTGAAASLYMRGTGLALVPTTLLAMADAALGGKTGFDYLGYKNILGTFYPAGKIFVIPEVLKTLPYTEYKSGLAEIIKHGMLKDSGILAILKSDKEKITARDESVLQELVSRSLDVKGWFVGRDFREENIRRYLNLGHTFGHALESVLDFKGISHGEAVIWGISMALKTGLILKETQQDWVLEAEEIFKMYGYKTDYGQTLSADDLIEAMTHDKKKKDGEVRFIFQKKQGETYTAPVDTEILRSVLSERI